MGSFHLRRIACVDGDLGKTYRNSETSFLHKVRQRSAAFHNLVCVLLDDTSPSTGARLGESPHRGTYQHLVRAWPRSPEHSTVNVGGITLTIGTDCPQSTLQSIPCASLRTAQIVILDNQKSRPSTGALAVQI